MAKEERVEWGGMSEGKRAGEERKSVEKLVRRVVAAGTRSPPHVSSNDLVWFLNE